MKINDKRDRILYASGQQPGRVRSKITSNLFSALRIVAPAVLTVSLAVLLTLWSGLLPTFASLPTNPDLAAQPLVTESNNLSMAQSSAPSMPSGGESPVPMTPQEREESYMQKISAFRGGLGVANIFVIFFVTLGPLKTIGPFVKITQNADEALRRNLAIRSAALAAVVIVLVALIGGNILSKWTVSMASLTIAAGFLLFLSSLQVVMAQYEPAVNHAPPPEPSMKLLISPLVFPSILPPYGIAIALILMITNTRVYQRPEIVLGLLVLIMVLNLLAMLAARPILKALNPAVLQVVGLVLSVMQLALGLEFILIGIQFETLVLDGLLS